MKLFRFELEKLGKAYMFLLFCLLCIMGNLLYRAGEMDDAASACGSALWEELAGNVAKLENEEALAWLDRERSWYSFLSAREYYGESPFTAMLFDELRESYPEEDWEARLEAWMAEPEAGDGLQTILSTYAELASRYDYMLSYPDFLRTVEEQAENMRQLELFSGEDAFSGRNVLRTARVYKRLEGLELGVDYSSGVEAGTDTLLADGTALVLVLALSWLVWAKERDQGLYLLLQSTCRGKRELGQAKLWACACGIAFLGMALYGSQLLLAFSRYGVGNTRLPLPSIPLFRNCPFMISIGEYLFFFMGIKLLGMLLYGGLCMAVMTSQSRFGVSVAILFGVLAGESAAYIRMDALSPWNPVKFVNLFAVLDARAWFTAYQNLNLFSHPVSVTAGKLLLCIAGLPAAAFFALSAFRRRPLGGLRRKVWRPPQVVAGCHASLFLHEGYKLYILSGMAVMAAALAWHVFGVSKGIPDYQRIERVQVYQYYIGQVLGEYTEDTALFLTEEEKLLHFQDEEALAVEASYEGGSLSDADYWEWLVRRNALVSSREEAFCEIREQERNILTARERWQRGGFVDKYQVLWLLEDDGRQLVFALLYLAAMTLGISGLAGMEMQYGMEGLTDSAVNGGSILWRRKMEQILLCGTFLYGMIYLPYYSAVWRDMERVEPGILLQSIPGYGDFPFALSIRQAFWLMVCVRYMAAMCCSILAAAAVKFTKGVAMGCFAGCALFVLPCALCLWGVPLEACSCAGAFLPELAFRSNVPGQYFANWLISLAGGIVGAVYCMKKV